MREQYCRCISTRHYETGVCSKCGLREKPIDKANAILKAVRTTDVGSDIIIHNDDGSIWCILTIKSKEHMETL